jgi:hypothetical protein
MASQPSSESHVDWSDSSQRCQLYLQQNTACTLELANSAFISTSQKPDLTVPVDFPANIVFPDAFSWRSTISALFFYQKRKFRLYLLDSLTPSIFLTSMVVNQHTISRIMHNLLVFNCLLVSTRPAPNFLRYFFPGKSPTHKIPTQRHAECKYPLKSTNTSYHIHPL